MYPFSDEVLYSFVIEKILLIDHDNTPFAPTVSAVFTNSAL